MPLSAPNGLQTFEINIDKIIFSVTVLYELLYSVTEKYNFVIIEMSCFAVTPGACVCSRLKACLKKTTQKDKRKAR